MARMSFGDGRLAGKDSKTGLVAVASTTSVDTFSTIWLGLVTFDLPYSTAESA